MLNTFVNKLAHSSIASKRSWFLLWALLYGTTLIAQSKSELDSLLWIFSGTRQRQVAVFQTLTKELAPRYALHFDSLQFANDTVYASSIAHLILAQGYHACGDYSTSSQLCHKIINYFYESQDTPLAFASFLLQSSNFIQLGLSSDAVPLIVKSLSIANTSQDTTHMIRALSLMGSLYLSIERPEASLVYTNEALEYCRNNQANYHRLRIELLCLQCEAFLQNNNTDACLASLQEAKALESSYHEQILSSKIYRLLGDAYLSLGQYTKAEHSYLEALLFARTSVNRTELVHIFRQLSALRNAQNRSVEALSYNEQALQLADSLHLSRVYRTLLWQRYELARTNNPLESLHNLEQYVALGDSLAKAAVQTKLSILHERYERQLREQQIEVQQLQISRDKYAKVILIASIVLLIVITSFIFLIARQRKRRLQYMEDINVSKNRFFSIISHDAKNHALAIQMVLGQLLSYYSTLTSEQIKEFLVQIKSAADMQIEFLVNLLNWARLQLDAIPYLPVAFDLNELVKKNETFFALSLSNKSITLDIDTPPQTEIFADRDMIDVILRNVLSNAIKFSHPNSSIELRITATDDEISLTVQDHGMGMTNEQIAKIGRIEQRILNTGTRGEKGSGLGLILCMSLARTNGATIHVTSKVKEGTAVMLIFPKIRKKNS